MRTSLKAPKRFKLKPPMRFYDRYPSIGTWRIEGLCMDALRSGMTIVCAWKPGMNVTYIVRLRGTAEGMRATETRWAARGVKVPVRKPKTAWQSAHTEPRANWISTIAELRRARLPQVGCRVRLNRRSIHARSAHSPAMLISRRGELRAITGKGRLAIAEVL